MRPLRVATLFTRLHIGGDENRVLTFARHCDRDRFEHQVVVMVTPEETHDRMLGPMVHRYAELGVECHFLGERPRGTEPPLPGPLAAARDARRLSRVCLRLAAHLRAQRIDVVDARMAQAIPVGLVAGRLAGAAVVATEYYETFWDHPPWRQLGPGIFSRLDALICDSQTCLDKYQTWVPALRRGVVIRNGIDVPVPQRGRAEVRRELGIPEGATLVAQVSRLVPYKGHRILLEAAARVMAARPEVHLLICGYAGRGDDYVESLWAQARELGIGGRVSIAGYPGPIADIWGAVDVHAHASEMDSAPIAIHESMALGLPAVVSSAGGIPELVEPGESALIVPAGQPAPLAEALARVLDDPLLSQRLGDGARRRYLAHHRPEHMAAQHGDLFEDAARARRSGAPWATPWRGSRARV